MNPSNLFLSITLFLIFILGYALYFKRKKQSPLNVDLVINRAVLFLYSIGMTLSLHTMIVYFLHKKIGIEYAVSSTLSGGIIMLIMLFIVHFQSELKLTDKLKDIIYDNRYTYRNIVDELDRAATGELEFDELMNLLIMMLVNNLGIEKNSILLVDRHRAGYVIKASYGLAPDAVKSFSLPLTSELVNWLREKRIIFTEEGAKEALPGERFKIIAKDLKGLGAKFSIPLFYKKELVGILNVGEKKSEKPFTQEEIDIIDNLARQSVIHIKNALLYEESITDSLTRLYHHEYFYHRLNVEMERARRYLRPLSLLMIDLDRFREYNNRHGHQAGDEVLKKIATILQSNIRKVDIVARYGGEEFSVIAPETPKKGAESLARRLKNLVKKYGKVTISIGVATYDRYEEDFTRHKLIKAADEAVYKAKEQGGDTICTT